MIPGCFNATRITAADGYNNVTLWMNDSAGNVNFARRYFSLQQSPVVINSLIPSKNYGYPGDQIAIQANLTSTLNISSITLNLSMNNQTIDALNESKFSSFINPLDGDIVYANYTFNSSGNVNCEINVSDVNLSSDAASTIITIYNSSVSQVIHLAENSNSSIIRYRRPLDNALLTGLSASLISNNSTAFVLPNDLLNIEILSSDANFSVFAPLVNVSSHPEINLSTRRVDVNSIYDTINLLGGGQRYAVRYAYAIGFGEDGISLSDSYLAYFNYYPLGVSSINNATVFKCPYNFQDSSIDYLLCEKYSLAGPSQIFDDLRPGYLYLNVTDFSVFILAQDNGVPPPNVIYITTGGGSSGGGGGSTMMSESRMPRNHTIYPDQNDAWPLSLGDGDYVFFNLSGISYSISVAGMNSSLVSLRLIAPSPAKGLYPSSGKPAILDFSDKNYLEISLGEVDGRVASIVFKFVNATIFWNNSSYCASASNSSSSGLGNGTNCTFESNTDSKKQIELALQEAESARMITLVAASFGLIIALTIINMFVTVRQKKKGVNIDNAYTTYESLSELKTSILEGDTRSVESKLKEHMDLLENIKDKIRSI